MSLPEFMPIGRLVRQTGLSVGVLRHCDRLGLLAPRAVSDETVPLRPRGPALQRFE